MKATTWTAESSSRLDAALKAQIKASNNQARRAVRTGKVFVDGRRQLDPGFPVKPGMTLALDPAAPNPARTEPMGVKLVYRDDWLLIIDKPAGLLSTPTGHAETETALHAAMKLCSKGRPPKVVHRLDKLTSGLMVFARGVPATRALRAAIEARTMRRTYRCVVAGVPEQPRGLISSMLLRDAGRGRRGSRAGTLKVRPIRARDPGPMPGAGKLAITRYEQRAVAGDRAALELRLSTGRTHQIRIHLAELGCPVLGERVYARNDEAPRHALHAARLSLNHPHTGDLLRYESRWPADLAKIEPIGSGW